MSTSDPLRREQIGGVVLLTLNRPAARNAIDEELNLRLRQEFDELGDAPDVGCVVLTGSGPAFCAGGDVKAMAQRVGEALEFRQRRHRMWRIGRLTEAMRELPCPVIAAVNGPAIGLGFSLALGADLRLVGASASFAASFVRVGLTPDGALSALLVRAVGGQVARELVFTGRRISAEEAVRLGLALRVCEDDDLLPDAMRLADQLAGQPADAIALAKDLLNATDSAVLRAAVEREAVAQAVAKGLPEHARAAADFAARRAGSGER